MPMITFRGPAEAFAGAPDAPLPARDAAVLRRLHGVHSEDAGCLDEVQDEVLTGLGLSGGRLRLEFDETRGRLWITTSYLAPKRLSEDDTARLQRLTEGQWADGLGCGCFWNHAGEVPSTALGKAIQNQDPNFAFPPDQLFVDVSPEEVQDAVEVEVAPEGDPDALLVADLEQDVARGIPSAFFELGRSYDAGETVAEDPAKAAELYRRGAEAGHGMAMGMLGSLYREGRAVEKDPATGAEWFRKGMETGEVICKAEYADCLELGDGVPRDLERARQLYKECLEAGFDPVAEALERVEAALAEG